MHVFLIAAITVDGFIAEEVQQISTAWTSKEDKKFFSERTKQVGVIIMGKKTYDTIGRPLPGRLTVVFTRTPQTVPEEYQGQLVFTDQTPQALLADLGKQGYEEVAICGGAHIYTLFLQARLIDTLYLTIEPVIFGSGVKLFSQEVNQKLTLKNTQQLSPQTLLLEYSVNKK